MIKAIVFDLDDTLISEQEYIVSGFRHISKFIAGKYKKEEGLVYSLLIDLNNSSSLKVFNRLLEKLSITFTEDVIYELVREYRNHVPDIEFYADVHPCLKELRKRAIKTGIITDGYISTQRNKLKVLNADKYFDYIILTEDIGREYWKPHPKAFEMMRELLEVEFNEMAYIGDNPEKDFAISGKYPIKTARIIREGLYKGRLYNNGIKEDVRLNSLFDVERLLF